jgi:murein DD-endopeptidase MepM/ murein hydrolase activator NlpD
LLRPARFGNATLAYARLMWTHLTLKRTLLIVLLAQVTVALGLLVYMAFTDRALVLEIADRDELPVAEPSNRLLIPVAGVLPVDLIDSYGAPRSGGRTHQGIDIFAEEGTPVLAAASGVIVALDSSVLGGISLYQRDLDGRTIYFYGHLQRYAAGLKEGDLVRQGDVIAHVGHTGNVPPGSPHLHFSIYAVTDPNDWWRGQHLSPCDLLPCGERDQRRDADDAGAPG